MMTTMIMIFYDDDDGDDGDDVRRIHGAWSHLAKYFSVEKQYFKETPDNYFRLYFIVFIHTHDAKKITE